MFPVFFPGRVDPVGALAVFTHFVGGITEIITGNNHLGNLVKILLRQSERNRNLNLLFFCHQLRCRGWCGFRRAAAPEQKARQHDQDGRPGDQDLRQGAFLFGDR